MDYASRQKSDRGPALLTELTLLVRPVATVAEIRAFTDAERADAELYATEAGTFVEELL